MSRLKAFGLISLSCLSLALVACVPIPIPLPILPRTPPDSRTNIGEGSATGLRVGVSRREDVLFALGEPDQSTGDASRFVYSARRGRGGVFNVAVYISPYGFVPYWGGEAESMRHMSLVVEFDASGRVSTANWKSQDCIETKLGDKPGRPCIEPLGPLPSLPNESRPPQ